MAVFRRLILGGVLAAVLVGCSSTGTPPAQGFGQGLAEPTAIPQSEPVALRIPSIGLNTEQKWMPLGVQGERGVPVETVAGKKTTGAVQSPPVSKPQQLGWFCPEGLADGCGWPTPGESGGYPSVALGHVNGAGKPGVFAKLDQVKVGDTIEVDRADQYTAVFKVTESKVVEKAKMTVGMVYGPTTGVELRLISCGGQLDKAHHRYLGQVYVAAVLTEFRPKAA